MQQVRKQKKITIISLLLVVLLLVSACGGNATLVQVQPDEGVERIVLTGTCTATVENGEILVSLDTNLMEGTIVQFSIDDYDGTQLAAKLLSVSGAHIYTTFPIEADWEGTLYANVVASTNVAKQPSEVTEAYGRFFQNVTGEPVIWDQTDNIYVAQSGKIVL
ncbi:MAG: hypothetical protein ACOX3W_04970 [Christensenellaceae bacterium]|jgi:hypothetical protein